MGKRSKTPVKNDRVIRSDRPDGRFTSTAAVVHLRLKQITPALAFSPTFTRAQATRWRLAVRRRLRALLQMPPFTRQPEPRQLSSEPREGYRLERWEMFPEPDSVVRMMLLMPEGITRGERRPAVLCLPGSDHPMEVLAGEPLPAGTREITRLDEQAMAQQLAQKGVVALCVENPGTGSMLEPLAPDWRRQCMELIWMGGNYEGLSVFHKLRALSWLKRHPAVDRTRIATCGHSLGAKPALHLGVLDPTIRAVVWNSGAHEFRRRHVATNVTPIAPWQYIPGAIRWFDNADLMAALAPTPLLVTEGGRSDEMGKVKKAYALAGAASGFTLSYCPSFRKASARKLDRVPLPEGLSGKEYSQYMNATDDEHFFHGDVAVPWLLRQLA